MKLLLIGLILANSAYANFGMNECQTVCKNIAGYSECHNTCEYSE